MDTQTVSFINSLMKIITERGDTRTVVERFLTALRKEFVFDNVAAYLQDTETGTLEIVYARALGRAKTAEADAAWGETIANQVLAKKGVLVQEPDPISPTDDRLRQAYILGLPLRSDEKVNGALMFVRFGGPVYIDDHIAIASLGAELRCSRPQTAQVTSASNTVVMAA